jgi:hypothetical protein
MSPAYLPRWRGGTFARAGSLIAGETRALTAPGGPATTVIRFDAPDARAASAGVIVLINPDLTQPQALEVELDPVPPAAGGGDPRSWTARASRTHH